MGVNCLGAIRLGYVAMATHFSSKEYMSFIQNSRPRISPNRGLQGGVVYIRKHWPLPAQPCIHTQALVVRQHTGARPGTCGPSDRGARAAGGMWIARRRPALSRPPRAWDRGSNRTLFCPASGTARAQTFPTALHGAGAFNKEGPPVTAYFIVWRAIMVLYHSHTER
jgi:hypothetical protein